MTKYYEDGQVKKIFSYCPEIVDWFIIGGPADANEAQVFKRHYPRCCVLGFEPNAVQYQFQKDNDFPGQLSNKALWSLVTHISFTVPGGNNRCGSSVHVPPDSGTVSVETDTLDIWAIQNNSPNNIVLWIDIEGAELECLKGARNLLREHRIKLLNVEVSNSTRADIIDYLIGYKYLITEEWNIRYMTEDRKISDIIFRPETLGS